MTEPTTAVPATDAPATVSPDGKWLWNGTDWVPNPDAAATPPPPPAGTDPAAAPATVDPHPKGAVGDIVSFRFTDADPVSSGLVVGTVEGSVEDGQVLRQTGLLIVPLPDATFVPNSAIQD